MPGIEIFISGLLKFWPIIVFIIPWAMTQKRASEKRKADREKRDAQHDEMLKAINSVGGKLRALEEKVSENMVESILGQAHAMELIKEIKGKLEGILIFLPGNKTGHA